MSILCRAISFKVVFKTRDNNVLENIEEKNEMNEKNSNIALTIPLLVTFRKTTEIKLEGHKVERVRYPDTNHKFQGTSSGRIAHY